MFLLPLYVRPLDVISISPKAAQGDTKPAVLTSQQNWHLLTDGHFPQALPTCYNYLEWERISVFSPSHPHRPFSKMVLEQLSWCYTKNTFTVLPKWIFLILKPGLKPLSCNIGKQTFRTGSVKMNWNGDFGNILYYLLSYKGIALENCAALNWRKTFWSICRCTVCNDFGQCAATCDLWSFVQGIKLPSLTALLLQAIRNNNVTLVY